jgi:hypothetical protein
MNPAVKSWMSANINRGKQGPSFMDPAVLQFPQFTVPTVLYFYDSRMTGRTAGIAGIRDRDCLHHHSRSLLNSFKDSVLEASDARQRVRVYLVLDSELRSCLAFPQFILSSQTEIMTRNRHWHFPLFVCHSTDRLPQYPRSTNNS